jgi:3-oxoacyl-[acyl-carrier-protein] synthase-3
MCCGFEHLISVVPDTKVAVADLAREIGLPPLALEATLQNGLRYVPIAFGETTASLAALAVKRLLRERPDLLPRVNAVVFAHSLPVPAPPGVDLIAPSLKAGGLEQQPSIAVTGQPCAILHSAIQLAQTWLSSLPTGAGILVIGVDVPNHHEERMFFNSVMGDAAIAGVLTNDAVHHIIRASVTDTHIDAFSGELSPPDAVARFRAANAAAIRCSVEHCLTAAGVALDALKLIVPHTPNNSLWNAVSDLMRLPRDRFLTDYIGETGHMNSNDSVVHYLRAVRSGLLAPGDLALLINPGFGGTRGCTLLQR